VKAKDEILERLRTQLAPKFPGEEIGELIEWAGRLIDQLPDEPTAGDEELIRSAVVAALLERKATRRLARDGAFDATTGEPKDVLDRVARLITLKGTVLRQLRPSAARRRAAADQQELDDFRAEWAKESAEEAAPAGAETPALPETAEETAEPSDAPETPQEPQEQPYDDAPPWEDAP
jgi:hypothetical protein